MIKKLYHGSVSIIEKPIFGYGKGSMLSSGRNNSVHFIEYRRGRIRVEFYLFPRYYNSKQPIYWCTSISKENLHEFHQNRNAFY